MKSFNYLATPYRAFPPGKQAAFEAAIEQTSVFLKVKIPIFSPIIHCHPVDVYLKNDNDDLYIYNDEYFMNAAEALIVCELPGWDVSEGIKYEVWKFKTLNKHIIHMQPGIIPAFFNTALKEKIVKGLGKALDYMCNGPI